MKRDKGIDFLMFIAILMVVNSHLEEMYVGATKLLATGGVLGDALFFFCSGYKLFLGKMERFDNWYKRRIVRIYPSVVVFDILAVLILALPLTPVTLFDGWVKTGGYWFIKCIMVHYIALYLIGKYLRSYVKYVMSALWIGLVCWWCLCYTPIFAMGLFGNSKYEWYYMFIFSLLGAILGGNNRQHALVPIMQGASVLISSLVVHYGFLVIVQHFQFLMPVRIFVMVPMVGVIYGLYLISRSRVIGAIMERRVGSVISFLGGLCLEVYISSPYLQTEKYNRYFPLNIFVYFILVFATAFFVRTLARFVVQTFNRDKPYDYRAILFQ